MKTLRTLTSCLLSAAACATLAGCNLQQTAPIAVQGPALQGAVHGGQQPVAGASIQLYAAGNTGYGSAYPYTSGGTSLLPTPVLSDVNGGFSVTGDYTCPSAATQIYLVATGGTPNPPSGPVNPQIALMAALGPCGTAAQSYPSIIVNEISTVASVYALSPFMTGIANIGTTATNAAGLANAFATVNKLVNLASGTAGGPALPPGATVSVAKINTLADALAACINSTGGSAGQMNACGTLFTATTVNGAAPADTITAAMNLAHYPNLGTDAITHLPAPQSPFYPILGATPADYSLVVTYAGGGIANPQGLAADQSGNIWTANAGNNTATKIDALGATQSDPSGFLSGANGYSLGQLNVPSAIAIDAGGNAWLANAGNSTVSKIGASGTSSIVYSGGNLSTPTGIAIDAASNVWISNQGNGSVTRISSAGTLTNYAGAGIAAPNAIAINSK